MSSDVLPVPFRARHNRRYAYGKASRRSNVVAAVLIDARLISIIKYRETKNTRFRIKAPKAEKEE